MSITIVSIIVGIIVAGLWTLLVDFISKERSGMLWAINLVLGALGAVAANQLLVYGPMVLGISILPALVGSLVLAMIATYAVKKITKSHKITSN
ncbi:hypothetical protein ACYSNU_15635 [Enterococcus sp. LJL120]